MFGVAGNEVSIFYADDANGTNANVVRQPGQYFVDFILHPVGMQPDPPTSGYFNIRGEQGEQGESQEVAVFWADDAVGTNGSQTRQDGQYFITFVVFTTGTTPSAPDRGYFNIRGEMGAMGTNGISIVNIFYTRVNNLQNTGFIYSNPSTILESDHNFFISTRSNNGQAFPDGYDITSAANQYTGNCLLYTSPSPRDS